MVCSINQSDHYETYLKCPGLHSSRPGSEVVLLSQYTSAINLWQVHVSPCTSSLFPHLSLLWKQTAYCSVTSNEQRRGLFDNVLLNSPELQLPSQTAKLPWLPCVLLERWHPGCGLWSVRAQGAVTACCSFSRRRKKKRKEKALRHESPPGREEPSKDAAAAQAHSRMPKDDAPKRHILRVCRCMLSLSNMHCSQMIWKNTTQQRMAQSDIYPVKKPPVKYCTVVKVFYYACYKCCWTFKPRQNITRQIYQNNQKQFLAHAEIARGGPKVTFSIFLSSVPAQL